MLCLLVSERDTIYIHRCNEWKSKIYVIVIAWLVMQM